MNNIIFRSLILPLLLLLAATVLSCSGKSGKVYVAADSEKNIKTSEGPGKVIKMVLPEENKGCKLGEAIKVVVEPVSADRMPDSVVITFDGRHAATLRLAPWEFNIPGSSTQTTGRKPVKAASFTKGAPGNIVTRFIIVYSAMPPKRFGYKVIHTYPHDREAFTQGLFYHNGVLYEGTGQQTGSTLREVELTTGKIIRQLNLSPDLFGEGITLFRDRIYQVTWQSKVGFVYERATFRQINKIYYQSEGWGLTTIDDKIVMSDGTNVLYFYDPESFTVLSRLEVYDDREKVDSLNELEFINGEIWANIWMKDIIARIDPASGRVIGYLDLKGILSDPDTDTSVNVLNGIAWDSTQNRIFVTGKNWPKLFEIRVTE